MGSCTGWNPCIRPSQHALHPSQAMATAPVHTAAGTLTNHVKAEAVRPADVNIHIHPALRFLIP